ncbi:MAG TPA: MBL fold metallo-hydrolase [Micromonosporaceae bacterium]|nr:MBL fold metallo-hydrolase [Micromonosporaceae bacterium]
MSVELTWLGQAGFLLRGGGVTVAVDLFLSDVGGRRIPPPVDPATLTDVDLVLCTHEHWDHLDGPTVAAIAAASPGTRVVVPAPVVDQAVSAGVPADRVLGAVAHEPMRGLPAPVIPVPACHGIDVADAYNFGRDLSGSQVRYLGYVVELGGVRVYHAGDTIWWPGQQDVLRDLGVHVALLPINGRDPLREADNIVGNLDHREAALLADAAGVELLVPMHWDVFAGNRGFPDQLVAVIERLELPVPVFVPQRTVPFVFTPAPR